MLKQNAIVEFDAIDVPEGSHIDVYISNNYEVPVNRPGAIVNNIQKRAICWKEFGFDKALSIDARNKKLELTLWVNDSDESYIDVVPPELVPAREVFM